MVTSHPSVDFADYLAESGLGFRGKELFTSAERGAYENRPLCAVIKDGTSSKAADVTISADYMNINISVSGKYGEVGEDIILAYANKIYKQLRTKLDIAINGNFYFYCQALQPPFHAGFDENGRTTYEFNCEIMRRLDYGD